eukprot:COSAG01_NODE_413_length_17368_cov_15.823672_9_plen_105_part_00
MEWPYAGVERASASFKDSGSLHSGADGREAHGVALADGQLTGVDTRHRIDEILEAAVAVALLARKLAIGRFVLHEQRVDRGKPRAIVCYIVPGTPLSMPVQVSA